MKVIIERNGKTDVIEGDAVLVAVATDGGIEGCATVGETPVSSLKLAKMAIALAAKVDEILDRVEG